MGLRDWSEKYQRRYEQKDQSKIEKEVDKLKGENVEKIDREILLEVLARVKVIYRSVIALLLIVSLLALSQIAKS